MMRQLVLNIISLVVGLIGLSLSVVSIFRQIAAEKELSRKLKSRTDELSKFLDNKDLYAYANVNVDNIKLKGLIEEVKQVARELPEKRSKGILDALEQKSSKSRVNYLNRLLHLSGINVSISTQG
jgi:hypothetical protein